MTAIESDDIYWRTQYSRVCRDHLRSNTIQYSNKMDCDRQRTMRVHQPPPPPLQPVRKSSFKVVFSIFSHNCRNVKKCVMFRPELTREASCYPPGCAEETHFILKFNYRLLKFGYYFLNTQLVSITQSW
jgi:hypothetical protein